MEHAVIVGSGNVATHLVDVLQSLFQTITQVSRTSDSSKGILPLSEIPVSATVYFLAVSDDAIKEVANSNKLNGLVVHTSGSVSMEVLAPASERIGVFYPLQSFSKNLKPDWRSIPLLIEAKSKTDEDLLVGIANRVSERVETVDSEKRASLHVAAVFANNFTNYMMHIAQDLLAQADLSKDLLNPLMLETARKAVEKTALESQTGPAKRQDVLTMQRHLEALSDYPKYKKIYGLLSTQIQEIYG